MCAVLYRCARGFARLFLLLVPPLRERREAIPVFVAHFIEHFNRLFGKDIKFVSRAASDVVCANQWLGNCPRARQPIESAVLMTAGERIDVDDTLPPWQCAYIGPSASLPKFSTVCPRNTLLVGEFPLRPMLVGLTLQVFCRQPQIQRGSVNSPSTAYFEPWKCAAIDQAIDCRGVHAQYFGNLADGENVLEFRAPNPSPVHQLTFAIQIFPESRVTS
jgi:hypothetical protein